MPDLTRSRGGASWERTERDTSRVGLNFATVVLALGLAAVLLVRLDRPVRLSEGAEPAFALPDARVNVNTCPEDELLVLPGIGPGLAERIVRDRRMHGPFASVDDLERVDGIGPKLRERVGRWVVVE